MNWLCFAFLIVSTIIIDGCFLNSCPYRRYGRTIRCESCGEGRDSTRFEFKLGTFAPMGSRAGRAFFTRGFISLSSQLHGTGRSLRRSRHSTRPL
ncbi:hypothetical protein V3C99_015230 [Haemonchus contortus]